MRQIRIVVAIHRANAVIHDIDEIDADKPPVLAVVRNFFAEVAVALDVNFIISLKIDLLHRPALL